MGSPFPQAASSFAPQIDSLFQLIFGITLGAFIIVQGLLIWFLIRYRRRPGHSATYIHGNPRLEWLWTLIPAAILVCVAVLSEAAWAAIKLPHGLSHDAIQVEVLAEQFAWNIRYPGPDGKFGRTDNKLISQDNPWGTIDDDPDGKDDIITINQMHLPVERDIQITLRSKDVIHSFFLPEMRLKQDAVPGMTVHLWFKPTRTGRFEIACAEFCGLGHYRMRGFLTIESMQQYTTWIKGGGE
jgi:cytochrome c oxidase subunit 2